jgi:hypothetical protein
VSKSNSLIKKPSLQNIRSLFARERQDLQDFQFSQFLKILEQREYKSEEKAKEAVERIYADWAEKFELLKAEFNSVRDLFQEIENTVTGWYCVSPNLAQWGAVGWSRSGYTFATAIMKNHHRKAPRSEKSLSVTFALDEKPQGIGDESYVGFTGQVSDQLAGLSGCSAKSLREKGEGAKALYHAQNGKSIVFRLNHRTVGQQIAKLPLSILKEYSLKELCQALFLTLNNDIVSELRLNTMLENPQKLISAGELTD